MKYLQNVIIICLFRQLNLTTVSNVVRVQCVVLRHGTLCHIDLSAVSPPACAVLQLRNDHLQSEGPSYNTHLWEYEQSGGRRRTKGWGKLADSRAEPGESEPEKGQG